MERSVNNKQPNSKMCFVCGLENSFGLKARFYELEGGDLAGLFRAADEHQGYPGRLHGGLASTILDETMGRTIMMVDPDYWGVTVALTVSFKAPIPLEEEILVIGRITERKGRIFEGSGEIVLPDGSVAVSAEGRYLQMPLQSITDKNALEEVWRVEKRIQDPSAIQVWERQDEKRNSRDKSGGTAS